MRACTLAVLFLGAISNAAAEAPTPYDMVGTWQLIEWVDNGDVIKPPKIGARFSLHDGIVMWIVYRKTDDGALYDSAYGRYEVDEGGFRYGYEHAAGTEESGNEITLDTVLWPHDSFSAQIVDDELHLMDSDDTGEWGFVLREDRLSYMSDGEILRVYKRVSD